MVLTGGGTAINTSLALRLWTRLNGSAFGRWAFTRIICFRAPYFSSISPLFVTLEPGHAVVTMRKRRKVKNHIGTIHAIAMANLCEIAAGVLTEVSTPADMRWIPKGMNIQYLGKAAATPCRGFLAVSSNREISIKEQSSSSFGLRGHRGAETSCRESTALQIAGAVRRGSSW